VTHITCNIAALPRGTKSIATENATSATTAATTETDPTTTAASSSPTTAGDVTIETSKPTDTAVDNAPSVNTSRSNNVSVENLVNSGEMVSIVYSSSMVNSDCYIRVFDWF